MTVQCIFDDVSERDMDMLIAEEMVSNADFRKLFLDKIGISDADVLSVELSKTDPALGESDITVTLSAGGKRIGLLIEDKVDAIAMPEQAARYTLRGERGVSDGLYDEFYVFIAAPQKYLSENYEAAKYPNRVSYEEMLAYFQNADGRRNEFQENFSGNQKAENRLSGQGGCSGHGILAEVRGVSKGRVPGRVVSLFRWDKGCERHMAAL